jgi:hypothetical protein
MTGATTYDRVEPRLFGVAPPAVALILAAGALGAAIVLLLRGSWVLGVVLVAVAALCALAVLARESGAGGAVRPKATRLAGIVGGRARFAADSVRLRSSARRDLRPLHVRARELEERRRGLVVELGEAALAADRKATARLRGEIRALDEEAARNAEESRRIVAETRGRLDREHRSVDSTEALKTDDV